MKERRDRLSKALAISRKLWRMQTLRLAECEASLNELRAAELMAIDALDHPSCEPTLVILRLKALGARRIEAERLYLHELSLNQSFGRRAKMTERLHSEAEAQCTSEAASVERRSLLELPKISVP